MARTLDREKAVKLRKQGKTYSEIKKELGVSKSTLSNWLSNYPLTRKQMEKIETSVKKRKYLGIEKTRITKAKKRNKRLKSISKKEKSKLLPLTNRELYLCGLFLYWGEGVKGMQNRIGLNNTDPKVIKFYLLWLTKSLKIPKEKIRVYIHLYKDMNIEDSLNFWSNELSLPKKQFDKPYVKNSKKENLTHKGYGYGTCGLAVYDVRLKERVILGLNSIADHYSGLI